MRLEHLLVEIATEADALQRLRRIVAAAVAETDASGAVALSVDAASGAATAIAQQAASIDGGEPAAPDTTPVPGAVALAAIQSGAPVCEQHADLTWLAVPAADGSGLSGVLAAYRRAPLTFAAAATDLLTLLGRLAAAALRECAPRTTPTSTAAQSTVRPAHGGAMRAAFEGTEDGLLLFGPDGTLSRYNQRLLTLVPQLGEILSPSLTMEALVRACAARGYYGPEHANVEETVAWRLSADEPHERPLELRVDDRRLLTKRFRIEDGSQLVVVTDVTALRRADAALQLRDQHYRLLVDSVDDIIYQTDAAGRFTYINPRVTSILGWSADELLGSSYIDLIAPQARPAAARFYVQQFRRRIPSTYYEFPTRARSGQTVWVGQRVRLLEQEGSIIGAVGVARDITARRQAEQDERDRRQIVEAIARNGPLFETLEQLVTLFQRRTDGWRSAIFVSGPSNVRAGAAAHWPPDLLAGVTSCLDRADSLTGMMGCGEPFTGCLNWSLEQAGLADRAAHATPIRVADATVVGYWAIVPTDQRTLPLPADVQELLPELVHLAAVAIEHARLTERLEIRAARARTLNHLSQLISASLHLDTVLGEIARAASTLLGAPVARFWMVDEAADDIWLAADVSEIPDLQHGQRRQPLSSLRGILGHVVRERKLITVDDATADPRVVDARWWEAHGLRSFLGQPVMLEGRLLAVLLLWGPAPFHLDEDDAALLEAFVAHAAASIRNAQLFQAADQQRQQLQSLVKLSQRLSHGLDPNEVLDAITEAAAVTFGGSASMRLLDGDALVRASVSSGARRRPWMERVSTDGGLIGEVFRTGRPIATADAATDQRVPALYRDILRDDPSTALLIAPVRDEERILGTLHIYRERGHLWTSGDLALAASLAEQAASALVNATRYANLQERLERAHIPFRVNQLLSEALDLEDILREIGTAAVKITGAVVASVWINDEASRTLTIVAMSDEAIGRGQQFRRAAHGEGAAGWVAQHRAILHVDDVFRDGRTSGLDWWRANGLRSSYTVPILDGDAVAGVLSLNGVTPIHLSDDTHEILGGLLAQAAAAIRNAALYREVAITNRRLEQEVRRNELLLNSVADGVFGVDEAGRITFINPAASRMLGYSARDVQGRDAHDLLHHAPSPAPAHACPAAVALREGREYRSSDDVIWQRDGRRIPVDLVVTPLQQEGRSVGAVVTFRDLTRQQEAERQRRAFAQSEKLRALGQLAGGVAHDLNQSLGLVVGHSELALETVRRGTVPAPVLQESLETILQGALDGAQTVNRLQTFVRGQPEGEAERVNVTALLTDVVRLTAPRWRDAAQAAGAPVRVTVNVAVGGGDEILGWPASLREALTNLVFNSIDAMPRGGDLQLAARSDHEHVIVEVVDSGSGIPPEVAARIFEPFYTTKGERGTGLGLSMVYGIVERHGGRIEVDSTPGQGTTMRLILPCARQQADARLSAPAEEAARSRSILIVDDEAALRRMMTQMLQLDGHAVVAAATAAEALVQLEQQRFDVVLSDHGLGLGMNGLELATQVRERWPGTRFILVTGWGGSIDPSEVEALGVEAVISKPYRAPELRQRINALS